MSNESTTTGPAERPRPSLPQFDPDAQTTQAVPTAPAAPFAQRGDVTQTLPAAAPTSELPVTPPATPYAYAGMPAPEGTAPIAGPSVPLAATGLPRRTSPGGAWGQRLGGLFAGRPPAGDTGRWSAKKTALTAGLAIVLASAGAIGAAAAMPAGATGGDSFRGPGGGRSLQLPGGGNGQGGFGRQNQQLPSQQGLNGQQLPNLQNGVPGGGLGGIDPNQLSQLDPQDLLEQLGQGVDPFSDGGTGSGSSDDSAGGVRTT